jgi:hypothetical protein
MRRGAGRQPPPCFATSTPWKGSKDRAAWRCGEGWRSFAYRFWSGVRHWWAGDLCGGARPYEDFDHDRVGFDPRLADASALAGSRGRRYLRRGNAASVMSRPVPLREYNDAFNRHAWDGRLPRPGTSAAVASTCSACRPCTPDFNCPGPCATAAGVAAHYWDSSHRLIGSAWLGSSSRTGSRMTWSGRRWCTRWCTSPAGWRGQRTIPTVLGSSPRWRARRALADCPAGVAPLSSA